MPITFDINDLLNKSGKINEVETLSPRIAQLNGRESDLERTRKINELIISHNKLLDILDIEVIPQTKQYVKRKSGGDN